MEVKRSGPSEKVIKRVQCIQNRNGALRKKLEEVHRDVEKERAQIKTDEGLSEVYGHTKASEQGYKVKLVEKYMKQFV